jgi:hypothetical protein
MTVIIVCLAWGLVFGVIASLVWSFSTAKGTLADVLATLSIVLLTVYALVPNRPDWIAPRWAYSKPLELNERKHRSCWTGFCCCWRSVLDCESNGRDPCDQSASVT